MVQNKHSRRMCGFSVRMTLDRQLLSR